MKKWLLALVTVLMLAACGDADKTTSVEETIEAGTVGFEMAGGNIEEATGVPANEKIKILAAFDEYINAFNAEDITRYGETTAKNAKGFNYEEDLVEVQKTFDAFAIERQAEGVTIVKYGEQEAQVYADLKIEVTEEATNTTMTSEGRQVTVFVLEDGNWKVSSVHYISNN